MMQIRLERSWEIGRQIADGGFGRVLEAMSDGLPACVAKLVPKDPGAERELLFVDLRDVRHVVPIIDSGETADHWVLIMPRAECSLRDRLQADDLSFEDALTAMTDVATALVDLDGRVVHRDIKPENLLFLEGHWCLADFGISRYAEATTAPDTRKFAFTPAYAAPERWRAERATGAADVYSLGIMAHEMITGALPFGGSPEDLRDLHLHRAPPALEGVTPDLSALVAECLYKAPGARPSAQTVLIRLQRHLANQQPALSAGLARLQQTNLREVGRQAEAEREASAAQSAEAQCSELLQSSQQAFQGFSEALHEAILASASAAEPSQSRKAWTISLGRAQLEMGSPSQTPPNPWTWQAPAFAVIAHAHIAVTIPRHNDYEGRSHSLWFCDAQEEGRFQWFETAFMSILSRSRHTKAPFALAPGTESAKALWRGLAEYQVAWPFEPLHMDTFHAFVDRWASWFAEAAAERLFHPQRLPEREPNGSWRMT